MTWCAGLLLDQGLVMLADTRGNALTALPGRPTQRVSSAAPTVLPAAPTHAYHIPEPRLMYALVQGMHRGHVLSAS